MTDWIDAETLMEHWGIDASKLLELIADGLQPHDVLGRPVLPPAINAKINLKKEQEHLLDEEQSRLEHLKSKQYLAEIEQQKRDAYKQQDTDSMRGFHLAHVYMDRIDEQYKKDIDNCEASIKNLQNSIKKISTEIDAIELESAWQNLDDLSSTDGSEDLLDFVVECVFHIDNIARTSRQNGLNPFQNPQSDVVESNDADERLVFSFYKNGGIWKVGPKGSEADFPDARGFHCLRFLLQKPNEIFSPHVVMTQGKANTDEIKENRIRNELSIQSGAEAVIPKIDARTRKAIMARMDELNARLEEETDFQKRDSYQHELDRLSKHLSDSKRSFGTSEEQSRVNLRKNISRVMDKLDKACMDIPSLRSILEHLSITKPNRTIWTGYQCQYRPLPSPEVEWILDPPN